MVRPADTTRSRDCIGSSSELPRMPRRRVQQGAIYRLTSLNFSGGMCFGSGIVQSTNLRRGRQLQSHVAIRYVRNETYLFAGIHGQASPQPMVTTASKGAADLTSSRLFDACCDKS
jgi:hypothetical protein